MMRFSAEEKSPTMMRYNDILNALLELRQFSAWNGFTPRPPSRPLSSHKIIKLFRSDKFLVSIKSLQYHNFSFFNIFPSFTDFYLSCHRPETCLKLGLLYFVLLSNHYHSFLGDSYWGIYSVHSHTSLKKKTI